VLVNKISLDIVPALRKREHSLLGISLHVIFFRL